MKNQILLDCGHQESEHSEITSGYGIDSDGKKHCYACCAVRDVEQMKRDGKTVLYLVKANDRWQVANWPGSLTFNAFVKKGSHNIAGSRYDVWFTGPDQKQWHGVQYGEMTQLCHCKRLKA